MSAKSYTDEELAALPHFSVMADGYERKAARLMATIDARDAELARLRAAVPADVAETIRDLYSRANALTVQVPGMTITALTMREAAHALESLAAENARLKASVPADVAGLVKEVLGLLVFGAGGARDVMTRAADALESQARELAAKDERIAKLEARIREARTELVTGYREWDSDQDHRVGKRIANACETLKAALAQLDDGKSGPGGQKEGA